MNKYIISEAEAHLLFGKLISEGTPITAAFGSPSGLRATIRGFLDSISPSNGILVSATRPVSDPQQLAVPYLGRPVEISYSDGRNVRPDLIKLAEIHGDTQLVIKFQDTDEFLFLTFTL